MTTVKRQKAVALMLGSVATSLIVGACSPSKTSLNDSTGDQGSASQSGTESAEDSAIATAVGCQVYDEYLGFEGSTVTVFTAMSPNQQQLFEESWAEFEECTGIDIIYEASEQFETQLSTRISSANPPDIAWIPRPATLAELVAQGGPVAAPESTAMLVDQYWNPEWKKYGTVDGVFYAAPLGSNMESLVWYSPKVFAANGYTIPTTWDELWALSDRMVDDGIKPWCGGLAAEEETGQPASDWLEQVMLRMHGGDAYDQWVAGDLDFSSREVETAMNVIEGWMKNPEYVNGGHGDAKSIASTPVDSAGVGILTGECGMLQQSSSYAEVWNKIDQEATVNLNGSAFAFYLPEMTATFPKPVVGSGELVAAFSDRPEVQAVQTYFASPRFHASKVALGTWVSANTGVPLDIYPENSIDRLAAEFLSDPRGTFRFDASDAMPSAVGAGAEWVELTSWFAEDKPTKEVLADIDAAWPNP